jgi:hypothetical protein
MAYETRKIRTNKEIKDCIEMYLPSNEADFMPVSPGYWYKHFWSHVKSGKYNQLYLEDGVIKGWILGSISRNMHFDGTFLNQEYFFTSETGFKAFRITKILHERFLEEAAIRNCYLAMSTSSPFDDRLTVVKMLEYLGWTRRNHIAIKRV